MHGLAFIVADFLVEAVKGLTGVGGGSLMTPTLVSVLGVKPCQAVDADPPFAGFTKLVGTHPLVRLRHVCWRTVGQSTA